MKKARLLAVVILALAFLYGCPQPGDSSDNPGKLPPPKGSISGTIKLPSRLQVDSDTRDPLNSNISNNTPALAQAVANIVMIAGNASLAADPDDYFSVTLTAGETVKLTVSDSSANLDLFIYQAGSVVASSTGPGKPTETCVSPGTGAYQVLVRAIAGSSNYGLQIGALDWNSLRATGTDEPRGDFVPGEALVKVKAKKTEISVAGAVTEALRWRAEGLASRHRITLNHVSPQGHARLLFPTDVDPSDINARDKNRRRTLARIRELKADPDIEWAEPNFIVRPAATPNDTYWTHQWDMVMMNLPAAWDLTTGSTGVIVAVIDTGVLYNHPDLTANILRDGGSVVGYDFIANVTSANDGDGRDNNPYDSGDEATATQSSYHGTHVAGTIGASSNNSSGIAGVNWNVRIMPVRVLGKDDGAIADVAEGIKYAAGLSNGAGVYPRVGGVITPADVINLSLGGPDYSQTLQDAISMARSAGVTVVAAAGNSSTSTNFYPAACTGVIGVSAVDYAGALADYSNFGTYIDLTAPGGDTSADLDSNGDPDGILSTLAVGLKAPTSFNYAYYQGTSMACPHVAGVIALMKARYHALTSDSDLSPDQIDRLIRGTVPGIGSITNYTAGIRDNNYGYGLLDAQKAVTAAGSLASLPPVLNLGTLTADFGFTTSSMNVEITNDGGSSLANLAVSPYVSSWLSHSLTGKTITLTVNRNTVLDGNYTQTIDVTSSNGGSKSLLVKMSKGSTVSSSVGNIYVVLTRSDGTPIQSVYTTPGLSYFYNMLNLKQGLYRLMAGTDLDNDGYLGDSGEFFGKYPSTDSPVTIGLSSGEALEDHDFLLEPVGVSTFVVQH